MNKALANEIVALADALEEWRQPSDALSDRAAENMYAAHNRLQTQLERLCLEAMMAAMIKEARREIQEWK